MFATIGSRFLILTAALFVLPSLAFGQLGGVSRNGDRYFLADAGAGALWNGASGGHLRLGWGVDAEDSKWELGVNLFEGQDGMGGTAATIDATALFDYDFEQLTLSFGLGIDINLTDFGSGGQFDLGPVGVLMLSFREPRAYDPYAVIRVREENWEIGAGFRIRY